MSRARQDRVIALLSREGDWVTAAELADVVGVTPRSIRSYVTALNARVPGGLVVESGPLGYRAGPDATTALRAAVGDMFVSVARRNQVLLSRQLAAGEAVSLAGTAPWRIKVGNAGGTELSLRGQRVDLVPHTRNNVARLELN